VDADGDGYGANTLNTSQTCTVDEDTPFNYNHCYSGDELFFGDFIAQNNVWNSSAMYRDDYYLCVELTGSEDSPIVKWHYNFFTPFDGNEYQVKAYPQVYYGSKMGATPSGTEAELGLPALVADLPNIDVHYSYTETGIGERNVSFESFFHEGGCDEESIRDEESGDIEMMVWVNKPTIRTGGAGGVVDVAVIDGEAYDIWLNGSLGWSYIAFVKQIPSNSGSISWSAFIDFTKQWIASKLDSPDPEERAVAEAANLVRLSDEMCMAAVELGTEIFWGQGEFTLFQFDIDMF